MTVYIVKVSETLKYTYRTKIEATKASIKLFKKFSIPIPPILETEIDDAKAETLLAVDEEYLVKNSKKEKVVQTYEGALELAQKWWEEDVLESSILRRSIFANKLLDVK